MTGRWLRWLALAALVAVGLLPLLPQLVALWPATSFLERAARVWFDFHCERDPARTPRIWGVGLAVCARCAGIYAGLGAGGALRWPRLTPRALRAWVFAAAALMLLDIELEERGLHGDWPAARLLTGLLLGFPVGAALGQLAVPSARAGALTDRR